MDSFTLQGRISYYIKMTVLVMYIISVPILFGAFYMYWKQCITYMYDIFGKIIR